jgi:hypothetical protein
MESQLGLRKSDLTVNVFYHSIVPTRPSESYIFLDLTIIIPFFPSIKIGIVLLPLFDDGLELPFHSPGEICKLVFSLGTLSCTNRPIVSVTSKVLTIDSTEVFCIQNAVCIVSDLSSPLCFGLR